MDPHEEFLRSIRSFAGDKSKLKNIEDRKKEAKKQKQASKETSAMDHNDMLREALKNRRGYIDGSKLDKKEKKEETPKASDATKLPSLGEVNEPAASKGSAIDMISALIPPPPPPGDDSDGGSDEDDWN